jgi:adenylosuccinate lyase
MINRYEVEAISRLWTDQARFERLLTVELALLEALEEQKIVPSGTRAAFSSVQVLPKRIEEIEMETKHDVIAFCSSVTEQVDPVHARYFHFGVTSSDVLDTALSLQVKDSLSVIINSIRELLLTLDQRIEDSRTTLAMGRSHGMSAEPMIFAQKFLSCRVEFERRLRDYEHLIQHEVTGQISGAVGNYTILSPEIEALTLSKLGLPIESVSSQVIPRDHLALITSIGALTASAIERMAIELRHLHHSDIGEVHEGFASGQKGSSTMPHKKKPCFERELKWTCKSDSLSRRDRSAEHPPLA